MPKTIRLNATHYFIMKIPNKIEQIASNHSSDNGFKDFIKLYKGNNDTTLSLDNPLNFRKDSL